MADQTEVERQTVTLENCGPEDVEFNRQWHLVSANRVSFSGTPYARPGESITTANVGAWYETACCWRDEAEKARAAGYEAGARAMRERAAKDQCSACALGMAVTEISRGVFIHEEAKGRACTACAVRSLPLTEDGKSS